MPQSGAALDHRGIAVAVRRMIDVRRCGYRNRIPTMTIPDMFNGYFNERSECLVGFTGRKLRQCPVCTGGTSLGVCERNEVVEEIAKRFMKAVGYDGVLDMDFRYDARDGQYKVLDVNPRVGSTFRLFVSEDGMDVARAFYLDLTGQPLKPAAARDGRKWFVEDFDLVASLRYRRDGKLGFPEWLRPFRDLQESAFFALDDPLPMLLMLRSGFSELFRRVKRSPRPVPPFEYQKGVAAASATAEEEVVSTPRT